MKKKVRRFDVWVTRHHFANNGIKVSSTATTDIERVSGCTLFNRIPRYVGRSLTKTVCLSRYLTKAECLSRYLTKAVCLSRYGFLPQPATCWNVWIDEKGVMQHQEYPLLEKYSGRTYKAKPIASEKEYYL